MHKERAAQLKHPQPLMPLNHVRETVYCLQHYTWLSTQYGQFPLRASFCARERVPTERLVNLNLLPYLLKLLTKLQNPNFCKYCKFTGSSIVNLDHWIGLAHKRSQEDSEYEETKADQDLWDQRNIASYTST